MKLLVFSPHAYYSVWAIPEAIVAEAIQNKGHEIILVGCNGIYKSYCACMSSIPSVSTNEVKQKICTRCFVLHLFHIRR